MKYLFDRTASLFGLLLLWPALLIVALLIRMKMPGGPVIFTQHRVGRDGRLFTMYKFRSMGVQADDRLALRIVRIRSRREPDHASRGEITQI